MNDGQTDGRTDGQTAERTDRQTDRRMDGQMYGRMDGRTDGQTDDLPNPEYSYLRRHEFSECPLAKPGWLASALHAEHMSPNYTYL